MLSLTYPQNIPPLNVIPNERVKYLQNLNPENAVITTAHFMQYFMESFADF